MNTEGFMKQYMFGLLVALTVILSGCSIQSADVVSSPTHDTISATQTVDGVSKEDYDVVLYFPGDRYPETATHIASAIEKGESAVCTIDRDGADANRDASLEGIPTKKDYDRDEWPMALCEEGGKGADVAYVAFSDNRGSGSWVGNQLEEYPDGTRILFVIDGGVPGKVMSANKDIVASNNKTVKIEDKPSSSGSNMPSQASPEPAPESVKDESNTVYYANCSAVKEAGVSPLHKGDPGYSTKLDRDQDGIACEN